MCGINVSTIQWCDCIFILCYTHLKLTLLLHEQGLVATRVATTVQRFALKFQLEITYGREAFLELYAIFLHFTLKIGKYYLQIVAQGFLILNALGGQYFYYVKIFFDSYLKDRTSTLTNFLKTLTSVNSAPLKNKQKNRLKITFLPLK